MNLVRQCHCASLYHQIISLDVKTLVFGFLGNSFSETHYFLYVHAANVGSLIYISFRISQLVGSNQQS